MIKKVMMFVVLAAVCLGSLGPSDETCCPTRDLAMTPTPMPAGQEQDLSNFYEAAVLHPLIWDAIASMDASCPEITFYDLEAKAWIEDIVQKIDAAVRKQKDWPPDPDPWKPSPPEKDMDYILRGTLTAEQVTGKNLSGNLEGTFTFRLELVDHHHKNTVVKEASTSWTGGILYGGDAVQSMAETFRPLPPLLKGYERIPEKADVDVPNDKVEAGETGTITLSKLFDKDGRQTQWWQRLFVHIEKGKILNAEKIVEHEGKRYHVFRANEGTVKIRYQAPDECKKDRETLTVYNCCEKKEPPCFMTLRPRKEIAKKEFDIVCNRWRVELTYTEQVSGKDQMGEGLTRMLGGSYKATVKAVVEYVKTKGHDQIYESKSAELDLNDTFNQHIVLQNKDFTCEGRIALTGTNNGVVQVPVIMMLHTRQNRCSFGWGRWGGAPISYKIGINLWGDERCGPAKAWNGESQTKDVLFSADGISVGPAHVTKIPYSPGQKEITGQDQWTKRLWMVPTWIHVSAPIEQFPLAWRGMVGLLNLKYFSGTSPGKVDSHATLSWKATKLGK